MAGIHGTHTVPELAVRRFLHKQGFRYRLHAKSLPGRPDIVLPKYRTVVLVHGCFWHQHADCRFAVMPRTNVAFWRQKLGGNVLRDSENLRRLGELGWNALVIWECDVHNHKALRRLVPRIRRSSTVR